MSALINFFSSIWSIIRIPIIMVVKAGIPVMLITYFIKQIFLMIDKIINALAEAISEAYVWLEGAAKDIKDTFDFF